MLQKKRTTDYSVNTFVLLPISMKLIGYLRYDPAPECEDETTNTSLADQKSKIEAFCLQHNHHLILIVEEEGPSYPKERPQLQSAIDLAHSTGAEGIIVTDRSRLIYRILDSRVKDFPDIKLLDISNGGLPVPIYCFDIKRDPDLKTVLGLN
jgi:Resolvase, N terminal domain